LALDKSFVGKAFAPFTFEVDKSKIRELAQALDDDNPIFFDDAAAQAEGLPGIVAPPTFPSVLKMWGEGGSSPHIKTMGESMSTTPLFAPAILLPAKPG
jgi:hypothetical protein